MIKRKEILYEEIANINDLMEEDRTLVEEARKASETAYSPYSQFSVGAALRIEDGRIIRGSNQENIAYPSGLCAERVALFYAGTMKEGVRSIAVIAKDKDEKLSTAYPCGACLQVLLESERRAGSPIRIIIALSNGGFHIFNGIDSLMPFSFKF